MGTVGASRTPPIAVSPPASANAITATERRLSPISSAACGESADATSAWPTIVRRKKNVSPTEVASATNASAAYCGCTSTPPMFHARSEMARVRPWNLPEGREQDGLGEDRDSDGDDQAREMRGAPADADRDDGDERGDDRRRECRQDRSGRKRHPLAQRVRQEATENCEHSLREVHDARRPVHEDERHPDDGEDRTGRDADHHQLEERRHNAVPGPPPR